MFGVLREKLISEFAKKEETQETQVKTERSRRINASRLEVQEMRQQLLAQLREDTKAKIMEQIKDEAVYKDLLKKLIIQVIFWFSGDKKIYFLGID